MSTQTVRLFTLIEQADGITLNGYEVEEIGFLHHQEGQPPAVARLTLFDEGEDGTDYHFLDQEVALQDDGTAGAITCAAPGCEPESEGVRLEFKATGPFHFLGEPQTVCGPEELAQLRRALSLCVKAIDNLLPGAKFIPADVGLVNEALMAARPLCKEGEPNSVEASTGKDELIRSMLSDLHENFGWDELTSSLEEVQEAARELGIEES